MSSPGFIVTGSAPVNPKKRHDSPDSSRSPSPSPSQTTTTTTTTSSSTSSIDKETYPGHPKSLSGISLRAFLLGTTFATGLFLTFYLQTNHHHHHHSSSPLWRLPFFLSSLSLFHFLEFYITARYNPRTVSSASFLLSNGSAYTIAHLSASLECLLTHLLLPATYPATTALLFGGPRVQAALGIALMVVGQTARTWAMVGAGENFNHQVQTERRRGHELVTGGVYGCLRHPSYFGFFWWGLGTQVVLGNVVCLVGYAVVLWRFFARRIEREENALIVFFGDEYIRYRERTPVGIPGIP